MCILDYHAPGARIDAAKMSSAAELIDHIHLQKMQDSIIAYAHAACFRNSSAGLKSTLDELEDSIREFKKLYYPIYIKMLAIGHRTSARRNNMLEQLSMRLDFDDVDFQNMALMLITRNDLEGYMRLMSRDRIRMFVDKEECMHPIKHILQTQDIKKKDFMIPLIRLAKNKRLGPIWFEKEEYIKIEEEIKWFIYVTHAQVHREARYDREGAWITFGLFYNGSYDLQRESIYNIIKEAKRIIGEQIRSIDRGIEQYYDDWKQEMAFEMRPLFFHLVNERTPTATKFAERIMDEHNLLSKEDAGGMLLRAIKLNNKPAFEYILGRFSQITLNWEDTQELMWITADGEILLDREYYMKRLRDDCKRGNIELSSMRIPYENKYEPYVQNLVENFGGEWIVRKRKYQKDSKKEEMDYVYIPSHI